MVVNCVGYIRVIRDFTFLDLGQEVSVLSFTGRGGQISFISLIIVEWAIHQLCWWVDFGWRQDHVWSSIQIFSFLQRGIKTSSCSPVTDWWCEMI